MVAGPKLFLLRQLRKMENPSTLSPLSVMAIKTDDQIVAVQQNNPKRKLAKKELSLSLKKGIGATLYPDGVA